MNSSTLRGGRVSAEMTRDVVYYTVHAASLAVNGEASRLSSSLSNSPDSPPLETVTPPLDASGFDYVLRLDNLSSVRPSPRRRRADVRAHASNASLPDSYVDVSVPDKRLRL